MPRPVEPSQYDLESAFVQLRADGWPASLRELTDAARHYGVVLAAARHLANGGRITKPSLADAISAPPPSTHGRRIEVAPFPARRRDDGAVDLKSRAAGERDE